MSEEVFIVSTGSANLASVQAALARAGVRSVVTQETATIEQASRLVLPGVGAFGAAMERLGQLGLRQAHASRVAQKRPTLAICLGFQILFDESEEDPGVKGLGVWPQTIGRFVKAPRVPQFGWNEVIPQAACRFLEKGMVYFANSYRLSTIPQGATGALAEYGESFVAAIEYGGVLGCQFHPELSGALGQRILKRWLEASC